MIELLFITVFVAFLGSMFLSLAYMKSLKVFVETMKADYNEDWTALGRPRIDLSVSIESASALVIYLFRKKYIELDNPQLRLYGNRARNRLILAFVFLIYACVTAIFIGSFTDYGSFK